jgi:hypothetical protein
VGNDYPTAAGGTGSTIVDATGLLRPDGSLRIVRSGVIPDQDIYDAIGVPMPREQTQ